MPVDYIVTGSGQWITSSEAELLDQEQFARLTGLRRLQIDRLVRLGVLEPVGERQGEPLFAVSAVRRTRRVLRLRRDLELSWSSLALVDELLERIDELESHLRSAG